MTSNVWEDVLWPNIMGDFYVTDLDTASGSFYSTGVRSGILGGNSATKAQLGFKASSSNSIYSASSTVQPKSLTTIYLIKF